MSDIVIERESVDDNNTENENSNTKKKPMTLTDLPEELLLYLVTFSTFLSLILFYRVSKSL